MLGNQDSVAKIPIQRIAFHESGHAVVALSLGHQVDRVMVDPDDPTSVALGKPPRHCVMWSDGVLPEDMELRHARDRAMFAFAGDAAEMHLLGGRPPGELFEHGSDYSLAMNAAVRFFPEIRQRHAFIEEMEDSAHAFVREPLRWHQIQAIATALLDRRDLTGSEARQIFDTAAEVFKATS